MISIGKITTVSTYPQVVNYLLHTYATYEYIADTEDVITMFSHPPNKTPLQSAKELLAKEFWCGDEYGDHDLDVIFIRRLDESTRKIMKRYWALLKSASLHDVAFYATLLHKLEGGQQESLHSHVDVKSQNRRTTRRENGVNRETWVRHEKQDRSWRATKIYWL